MSFKVASKPDSLSAQALPVIPVYIFLFAAFWVYTGFTTTNFTNWLLENTLTIPFVILLYYLYRWHKFSNLSVHFIFIFLLLHVYGSQHTYPENPFGFWLQEVLQLQRNHFDRIVHFGFGFLLAYPMYDIFRHKLHLPHWLTYVLPLNLVLSLGALYELVEWIVADLFLPTQKGISFLGIQGDFWDAQKDMGLAVAGAAITLFFTFILNRKARHPANSAH